MWIRAESPWREQDKKVVDEVARQDCYALRQLVGIPEEFPVVDVGAHIGSFAKAWRWQGGRHPIYCVEANPDNWEALLCNVGGFAAGVSLNACTYELGELRLANSIFAEGTATGASSVYAIGEPPRSYGHPQFPDPRPVRPVTLEQIVAGEIGLLKLDCEGSEHSILRNADVDRIRIIIGEWHDRHEWAELLNDRFRRWDYVELSKHPRQDCGIFHLRNPRFIA